MPPLELWPAEADGPPALPALEPPELLELGGPSAALQADARGTATNRRTSQGSPVTPRSGCSVPAESFECDM